MSEGKLPVVVVCSEGRKTSQEIIDNLRKEPKELNTVQLCDTASGYKFHNVTKYYENDIVFLSHEDRHIDLIPAELLDRIEGCIVYFDADNKDFVHKLPLYAGFMERNNVEFGILLCSELFDNPIDGITYKQSKAYSHMLDVVELDRKRDDDDDDDDDDEEQSENASHHNPIGYDEVLQAIRAIIWSNVDLKRNARSAESNRGETTGGAASRGPSTHNNELGDNIEEELSGFEQLLTEVMMFKDTTASWTRNARLAYAEKFAYAFDNLLQQKSPSDGNSSDDSDDESDAATPK